MAIIAQQQEQAKIKQEQEVVSLLLVNLVMMILIIQPLVKELIERCLLIKKEVKNMQLIEVLVILLY